MKSAQRSVDAPTFSGRVGSFVDNHKVSVDWTLAVGYGVWTFLLGSVYYSPGQGNDLLQSGKPVELFVTVEAFVAAFMVAAIVLFRRRYPVLLFALALAMEFALAWFRGNSLDGIGGVAVWIALWAVANRKSSLAAWVCYGVYMTAYLGGAWWDAGSFRSMVLEFGQFAAVSCAILVFFVTAGSRQRYMEALAERAEYLAANQQHLARLAVIEERARVAREMHDIVSHSLSVMIRLSDGAVAIAKKSPEQALDAMKTVAETGRVALGDMRLLVDVLRTGDVNAGDSDSAQVLGPRLGTADLDSLVQSFREASLPVTLELTADIPGDPVLELTIYRIVQESLTNALRYATGATKVSVKIAGDSESGLTVDVTDDGQSGGHAVSVGSGYGLVGMQQRASVYGGHVQSGQVPGGGWNVHADLMPGKDGG